MPGTLVDLTLHLWSQCGEVKGQDSLSARAQRVETVQTAVGGALGTV